MRLKPLGTGFPRCEMQGNALKTCYFYFPIEPLLARYQDDKDHRPLFLVSLQPRTKSFEIALFAHEKHIYMGRIAIPGVEEPLIHHDDALALHEIRQYVISFIKTFWPQQSQIATMSFHNFVPPNMEPHLDLRLQERFLEHAKLEPESFRTIFVRLWPARNEVGLLADSADKRIPLQYRYLSLYKLLESEFKEERGWNKANLSKFLAGFHSNFAALGLTDRQLENYVHALRDRCAHIKAGRALGVTMLSAKDANEVERFVPLMRKIAIALINRKYQSRGITLGIPEGGDAQ